MINDIKNAEGIIELLEAMESLCYYFGMKPDEFWGSCFKQINKYIQANLTKNIDNLKENISLQEAVTNKLIQADSMSKHPKIVPIKKTFKELYEEDNKFMSAEEITRKMRSLKASANNK